MLKRSSLRIFNSVVFALVLREMRVRFNSRRMGWFWFLFEPVSHILVMMAISVYLRGRHITGFDFPVFLVTGLVPYLLFKNIVIKGMEAANANQGLFAYRQITPFDCVVARVVVEFFLMACVYIALIFVLAFWGGFDVKIHRPLEWMGMLLVGMLFSFSLALIFCVWVDAMPDMKIFIRMAFMPLYFLSGVLIPTWVLPFEVQRWMAWNPFFQIIEQLRIAIFLNYPVPPGVEPEYPIFLSLVLLLVGMKLYRSRRFSLISI